MKALGSAFIAFIAGTCLATEQALLSGHENPERKSIDIAIIGAGAAGSSTAYHLSKYAAQYHVPLNITVFERNPYIGGRSTTVNAYNNSNMPVELGASIFVEVNQILKQAVEDFNLSTASFGQASNVPGPALGIWDGAEFRVIQNNGLSGWFDLAKLFWKYGTAPFRTISLMKATVDKFLRMYDPPYFPFDSLTQVAEDVDLLKVTAVTGEQYMQANAITGAFGRDVVQASTRVNYAQNLEYIHGLEAMVCMATDGAVSVAGGNWQIFDNMLSASGAKVRLNTEVVEITGSGPPYTIHSRNSWGEEHPVREQFDSVVVAAPYQYTNVYFNHLLHPVDKIPYVELHVTLFTSPFLLSPAYFNLPDGKAVPHAVLTTLSPDEPARKGKEGVGSPGFFSISLLRPLVNPRTNNTEYLYKIFSPSPTDAKFLLQLLDNSAFSDNATSGHEISWIYRKVWNSYPYEYPRVTFEDIRIGDDVYYTGGMESFISTMETNALMGKNVARLIIDRWQARGGVQIAGERMDL